MHYAVTLTRPPGTLSDWMGEGRGEGAAWCILLTDQYKLFHGYAGLCHSERAVLHLE